MGILGFYRKSIRVIRGGHLLVKGVFVCKVYAEVLGEFITKTKGYVVLCYGWKAYQVKKGDWKSLKGAAKFGILLAFIRFLVPPLIGDFP